MFVDDGDARIDKILNRAFDRFGVGRCKDDRINAGGDEILKDTLLFFDVIRLAGRIVKDLHAKFAAGLFAATMWDSQTGIAALLTTTAMVYFLAGVAS